LKILVLHGMLHLAGHDHEIDNGKMARLEMRLRTQLKLPASLIDRTHSATSRSKPARKAVGASSTKTKRRRSTS
jgi:probable rRNA maturation factor